MSECPHGYQRERGDCSECAYLASDEHKQKVAGRRERIATAVLTGMCCRMNPMDEIQPFVDCSMRVADALIAELERK